jgi:hypothetical protein
MPTLRERFPAESYRIPTALLGEDWVFSPANYPALADLAVVHEESSLCEAPLAIMRRISLAHPQKPSLGVQLNVVLCLNQSEDAVAFLFDFAGSFERPVPIERVWNTADATDTGDFGVAWSWSEGREPDIIAFVRYNVLVMLQGNNAQERLTAAARQIDTTLRGLRTTVSAYSEATDGVFSAVRRTEGDVPKVAPRGRLKLGTAPVSTERYFFLSDKGSVNRDPDQKEAWYYRAGTERGRREIVLFRLGAGILPLKERLAVDVE